MAQTFEDSHFKWTVKFDDVTLRDCDEIIGKLDIHLRDNPRCMEIEALLFKAFLYVAQWRRAKNKNSQEAIKCLETAFSKINNCQNDNARNGYSIVGYTLYWQIECNRHVESRKVQYGQCISDIVKTKECSAFINATRAFALSHLGPKRSAESKRYYVEALLVYQDNTDWLFGNALVCGRKARIESDEEALKTEEGLYNEILQLDPKHVLAKLFLAESKYRKHRKHHKHYKHHKHHKHHKHQESEDQLKSKESEDPLKSKESEDQLKSVFDEVLALAMLARQDDHCHTKVFTRVARFYRQIGHYKRALDILEEAERSIGEDPHGMLFHQKAMAYLDKYKEYDKRDCLLKGEKAGDKQSLLREALVHLTKAIDKCDSGGGRFRLDRAYVYEQLGMYEDATKEYGRLIDASNDYYIVERATVYLRYGLYLNRRRTEMGNIDLMMDCLSKGFELHVLTSNNHDKNSIPCDVYWPMSFYDRINASRCLSETCKVRAEALYRLGWLRLLFSDATLANWQQMALSKNNPTRKTHLQLYEQAFDEIKNNANDNPAPGFVSDIIEGLIICHLREGRKENLSKAVALIEQLDYRVDGASQKLADLKLAQCERSSESERPRLLSEAVQEGSLDACERLCKWFESKTCPSSDPHVLRYCVQIQNCILRDKLMYRQYNFLGGLYLHTLKDTADLNDSEIDRKTTVHSSIRYIRKRKDDYLDELREVYLRLLESIEAKEDDAVVITHSSQVICNARYALAHAIVLFQERFFSWHGWYTPPKRGKKTPKNPQEFQEFPIVKAAPNINVRNELKARLQSQGQKYWPMPEFSRQYNDLLEYLTSIQPAVYQDGSYDWLAALHDVTIIRKHREPLSQMEYTVSVGKDCKWCEKTRTFNTVDLAQTARFGVEKIFMELRNIGRKFDMLDRKTLRFAELKNLRVNRYREMERSSV